MSVEIEAKMSVDRLEPVRQRLLEAGATPRGEFFETNIFLDTEDRSLLAADEGLRLRANRNTSTGQKEFIITYKGPRQLGPLKTREEVELVVSSDADAVTLLERLGFTQMICFEKRRQSWKLGDCKVELDEVPHLGSFVEIEGASEEAVLRTRESLELNDRPLVKTSYVALLLSYLQERGQTNRTITFAQTGESG